MGLGGGNPAAEARSEERDRQARIRTGTDQVNQQFAGFNPQFYQTRAQDYVNFATPQLGQQFRSTQGAVMGDLANRGLLNSSARNNQVSSLNRELATQRQVIYDQGQSQAQALRTQVEGSRNNALSLLYSSADPGAATGLAASQAAQFQQPSFFQPVGNLFGNLVNSYYTRKLINSYNPTTSGNSPLAVNPGALP